MAGNNTDTQAQEEATASYKRLAAGSGSGRCGGRASCLHSESLLLSYVDDEDSQITICVKALKEDGYLENWQSGDGWFDDDDDEDFESGSGSDIFVDQGMEKVTEHAVFLNPGMDPSLRSDKAAGAQEEMLTYTMSLRAETTVPATKDPLRNGAPGSSSSPNLYGERDKVSSESLFQRTEVLAAVITGGVISLVFAVFLVLLLVYRMRKKDEGSYELGERKSPSAAYQKAPTKEFYA